MTTPTPHRFDRCDAACTTDCGHCKGSAVLKAGAEAVRDAMNDERRVTQLDYIAAAAVLGSLAQQRDELIDVLARVAWQQRIDTDVLTLSWDLDDWEGPDVVETHQQLKADLRRLAEPHADAVLALAAGGAR